MSALNIVTWNATTQKKKSAPSNTTTFDFLSIRVGADNLPLAQSGSGGSAQWDFGGKVVGNAADPLISTDLATKNYVDLNASSLIRITGPANITGTYNSNVWVTGTITMTGNTVIKGNLMIAQPGSGTTTVTNSAGYSLEVQGDVYLMGNGGLTTNINLSGSNGTGSVAAGAGGSLTIQGSVHVNNSADCSIDVRGGSGTNPSFTTGANGGTVRIAGSVGPLTLLRSSGGDAYGQGSAGTPGNITITGDCYAAITATGGQGGIPANGATISISGNLYGSVNALGGAGTWVVAGGTGGTVTVNGNLKTTAACSLAGGANSTGTAVGGVGGALMVGGCIFNSAGVTINGGTSATTTGGNGGSLTLGGLLTGSGSLTYAGGTGTPNGTSGSVSYI